MIKIRRHVALQVRILVLTVRQALHHHAQDLAASIAFWAFFSIFPLLIGILALTGYLLESAAVEARIFEVLTNMLPGSSSLVMTNLDTVMQYRGTMSWVGIVGLLWSAGKGFGAVSRAVNRTLGIERSHFFLVAALRQFAMALAVSVLVIVSIGVTLAVEIILEPEFLARLGIGAVEIPRLQGWVLSLVMVFLVFTLIYRLAPDTKVRWREVWRGAMLAAVLFELVKGGFLLYLDRLAGFEAIYGPLSSIIVLLLWLYISSLILIVGAEYNIVYSNGDAVAGD